jgi:AcrR family transcriptional regulator
MERGDSKAIAESTTALGIDTLAYPRLKPGPGRSAAEVASHQRARIDGAIVEVVSRRGYRRTTVREIARVAGISTRAFYEQYAGKEECFLHVHRLLAHGSLRRIEALDESRNSDDRLCAAVESILEWWAHDVKAARFLLLGPYGAGPTALKQLRLWERSLGVELGRCIGSARRNVLAELIATGIAAGMVTTVRSRMLFDGKVSPDLHRELAPWALAYACSSSDLEVLQAASVHAENEHPSRRAMSSSAEGSTPSASDDLTLLHSATAKLAAAGDRELLRPRHICAAAGVSRRSFDLYFSNLDSCLISAAELQINSAIEQSLRVGKRERTPASKVSRSIAELCGQIACSPALAYLCFDDNLESGVSFVRRDRLLIKNIAGLMTAMGPAPLPHSSERLAAEASLGAALGVIRSEVIAGRAGCLHLKAAPVVAFLMLAPTASRSSAVDAVSETEDRKHGTG